MTFGIWEMFTDVARYCWRERRAALRFGAIPYVLVAGTSLMAPPLSKESPAGDWALMLLLIGIQTIAYLPMSVAWYRMVVLGRHEVSRRPVFTLGRREGRFLFWQLAVLVAGLAIGAAGISVIALIYFTLAVASQLIAVIVCTILGVAGLLGWFGVLNRLSIVMVMAATDQPASLRAAWDLTHGLNGPLLGSLGLIGLAGLAGSLCVELLAAIAPASLGAGPKVLLQSAVSLVIFLAMPTLFGLVYLRIMRARAAIELNAAATPA